MNKTSPGKPGKKSLFRELSEWGVIVLIFAVLYFTGLHTVVIGTLQSLVLKTGMIRPDIHPFSDLGFTDYDFKLRDISGNVVDMRSLKGKTIFMNFWATWCPPCIAEMPDIEKLSEKMKDQNIAFLMISVDDDLAKAMKFAKKRNFSFRIYFPATPIPGVFAGRTIPSTYIISPDGKIVMKREGMARYNSSSFREFLMSLD